MLEERRIDCPYCGESIDVFLDASVDEQSYIEDCQVCCQPIEFQVWLDEQGAPVVQVRRDDE